MAKHDKVMRMNKWFVALAVLLVLVAAGCAKKAPVAPAEVAPQSTESQVSGFENDIAEVDSLNEDLDTSDIDSLDQDLQQI